MCPIQPRQCRGNLGGRRMRSNRASNAASPVGVAGARCGVLPPSQAVRPWMAATAPAGVRIVTEVPRSTPFGDNAAGGTRRKRADGGAGSSMLISTPEKRSVRFVLLSLPTPVVVTSTSFAVIISAPRPPIWPDSRSWYLTLSHRARPRISNRSGAISLGEASNRRPSRRGDLRHQMVPHSVRESTFHQDEQPNRAGRQDERNHRQEFVVATGAQRQRHQACGERNADDQHKPAGAPVGPHLLVLCREIWPE